MQIPYPKRKFIFDGEPSKDDKTDPHKVSYYSLVHYTYYDQIKCFRPPYTLFMLNIINL